MSDFQSTETSHRQGLASVIVAGTADSEFHSAPQYRAVGDACRAFGSQLGRAFDDDVATEGDVAHHAQTGAGAERRRSPRKTRLGIRLQFGPPFNRIGVSGFSERRECGHGR